MSTWQLATVEMLLSSVIAAGGSQFDLADTHSGKVLSVMNRTLVMTDLDGTNQHTHEVPDDAQIMKDGRPSGIDSLMMGDLLTVTLSDNGKVKKIDAKSGMERVSSTIYRDEVRHGYLR